MQKLFGSLIVGGALALVTQPFGACAEESGPETYDWLKTDGKGYIVTDCTLKPTTHVEMKFSLFEGRSGSNDALFWIDDAAGGNEWGCSKWNGNSITYYYNAELTVTDGLADPEAVHILRVGGIKAQIDDNDPVTGEQAMGTLPEKNIMLFASRHWKEPRPIQNQAQMLLYSFKVWEGNTLVRDYVPAKDGNGVATLYDRVNKNFQAVSGSGVFKVGNGPAPRHYLQTDGKGYFDLGFKPHLRNTRIEIVSTIDSSDKGQAILWAGSSKVMGLCAYPSAAGGNFTYYVTEEGGSDEGGGVTGGKDCFVGDRAVHTVVLCGNVFSVDGVVWPCGYETDNSEADGNAILFKNAYQTPPAVKLYSIKVWDVSTTPETLVHSFVPSLTSATLYDSVAKKELAATRVSSGTSFKFSVGEDTMADVPTCEATFEYDGTEKAFPLENTDGFTVLGETKATVPGTYQAHVVPNGGYGWADDGTHTPRVYSWTITGAWDPVATDFGTSNKVTIASEDYYILSFTDTAAEGFSWTVPNGVTDFEFLVVAGGGGGGAGQGGHANYCRKGGGGGAGGVVTGHIVDADGTFTVKVGAGGARGSSLGANGAKGGDSSLTLGGVNYVTAKGGGYGGGARYASTTDTGNAGGAGGSGGGGSSRNGTSTRAGGAREAAVIGSGVTDYQSFGNAGGQGYSKSYAGGGGGAGGAGGGASSSGDGVGGEGKTFLISGQPVTYACGGGTAYYGSQGDGASAAAGTGNGGAGGHGNSSGTGYYGEAGGSGIVIIRYTYSKPRYGKLFDYLESDGKGYIKTDYVPKSTKTRLVMDFKYLTSGVNVGFFQANSRTATPAGKGDDDGFMAIAWDAKTVSFYNHNKEVALTDADTTKSRHHTIDVFNDTMIYDGREPVKFEIEAEQPVLGPLAFFTRYNYWGGKKDEYYPLRVYSVRIYEVEDGQETLVREFLPATDANGNACLWDSVRNRCWLPTGSTGFAVGKNQGLSITIR